MPAAAGWSQRAAVGVLRGERHRLGLMVRPCGAVLDAIADASANSVSVPSESIVGASDGPDRCAGAENGDYRVPQSFVVVAAPAYSVADAREIGDDLDLHAASARREGALKIEAGSSFASSLVHFVEVHDFAGAAG
jgi:hypothetical protein